MSINAELIGVGPYSEKILDCLEYPAHCYHNISEGTMVIVTLFQCKGSSKSRNLAENVDCDIIDPGTHCLEITREMIENMYSSNLWNKDETEYLDRLVHYKFKFWFRWY